MAFRVGLHNFSKGVLSDEVQGRIDVAAYNAGAKQAKNCYILKEGGLRGRPGTRLVYETATADVRLIPFEVADNQTYMMLFEQASMKPLNLGGVVLEDELVITAITKAANAQVTVAFHAFVAGDEIFFSGQAGMTDINGRIGTVVAVVDANNFTVDIDTTTFGAWIANTGGIARVGAPTPVVPPVVPAPATPDPIPPSTPVTGGGADTGTVFGGTSGGLSRNLVDGQLVDRY
jgi:hypothetical protein